MNNQLIRIEFVAFASNIYIMFIKLIRFLHHTYRLFTSNIYASCIKHIGYSHGAEPILCMWVAFPHHVRALAFSVALQTVFHGLLLVCYIPAVTLHVVECRLATLDDQLAVVDVLILSSFWRIKNRYVQILRLTFASAADFFSRKLFGVMEKCFYLCLYKTK